jgi:hypothetical protein
MKLGKYVFLGFALFSLPAFAYQCPSRADYSSKKEFKAACESKAGDCVWDAKDKVCKDTDKMEDSENKKEDNKDDSKEDN